MILRLVGRGEQLGRQSSGLSAFLASYRDTKRRWLTLNLADMTPTGSAVSYR